MSWTPERIETLKRLWAEGRTASQIAEVLGGQLTRNAVIGKAHRLGLAGRPSPIKNAGAPKPPAPPKPPRAARPRPRPAALPVFKPRPQPTTSFEPVQQVTPLAGKGVSILALTERMCKWPVGDPRSPDFAFCGQPTNPGCTYCQGHAALAYQPARRESSRSDDRMAG